MRLCRIGEIGKEKPAIVDGDNNYKDLSSIVEDFNPDTLNFETLEKIKSTDRSYNLLNLIGSIFLLTSLVYKPNLSNIIIEIIWGGISLMGLYKYYFSTVKDSR